MSCVNLPSAPTGWLHKRQISDPGDPLFSRDYLRIEHVQVVGGEANDAQRASSHIKLPTPPWVRVCVVMPLSYRLTPGCASPPRDKFVVILLSVPLACPPRYSFHFPPGRDREDDILVRVLLKQGCNVVSLSRRYE